MNVEEAKSQLKLKGYCQFNLQDLNKNLYDKLKNSHMCNSEKNFKEKFNSVRADFRMDGIIKRVQNDYKSYQDAKEVIDDLLQKYNTAEIDSLSQIWYRTSIDKLYDTNNSTFETYQDHAEFINDMYNEIVYTMYDNHKGDELTHMLDYTYYDKGCRLDNHSDGSGTGRICACLIYLNENYDQNDGGCLVLNNTELILPIIGNVAIIDLEKFNVPHAVTEVTGGIGRYAMLSFSSKKGDKFV
jgi:Rps23 Pro-64 3,4-dihydroxylase Tpa1-like proline 4-hydroxylase